MELNEYQKKTKETAIYPKNFKVIYPALGLVGEAGEIAEKVKKVIRDKDCNFNDKEFKEAMIGELGDQLWYLARIADDLGLSLDGIANRNYLKLISRKKRGKLKGSGDNR